MGEVDLERLTGPQRKILRQTLVDAFRRSELDMFLDDAGFDALEDVAAPGPFPQQVFELLRHLERRGRLAELVARAEEERVGNPAMDELRQRLALAGPEAEGQRVLAGERLERFVRSAGFADLNLWAARLVEAGRRVCRIRYESSAGAVLGTGFLVGADRVLTNYHVVEPLMKGFARPSQVVLTFGYAETAAGPDSGRGHSLAEEWLAAHSPYGQADLAVDAGTPAAGELDFALLRLAAAAGEEEVVAGERRGWVDLAQAAGQADAPASQGAVVFILQHPRGRPLKQSIGIVQASPSPLRLRYDADTEPGSSGALVVDQALRPVALHHAGDPDAKIRARYNQGIPLTAIHQALSTEVTSPEVAGAPVGGGA